MPGKHIPGPWTDENHVPGKRLIMSADRTCVAVITAEPAELRLICAAPVLLDGLKLAEQALMTLAGSGSKSHNEYRERSLELIRAAIATGEGQ